MIDLLGRTASLLFQLTPGTIPRIFSLIETSRRNFEEIAFRGIPVLANQKNLWIVPARIAQKRDDGARARVPYHLELTDRSIGESNRVYIERDDLAGVDPSRLYTAYIPP
jgi:hypothetical protein